MSFQQGLSGLNAASASLDTIGNNVANANTVGFKGSQTEFADVFATSLSGASSNTPGLGVQVADVAQTFTQGNIATSSNPLDVAINGNGFFQLQGGNGTTVYSRNGQFHLDQNGFIVNSSQAQLMGYAVTNGVTGTTPVPLQINSADTPPKATANVTPTFNLPSTAAIPTVISAPAPQATDFPGSSTVSVYDTLGNTHNVSTYFARVATAAPAASTWQVYTSIDGGAITQSPTTLGFDSSGKLLGAGSTTMAVAGPAVNPTGAAPLSFNVVFNPANVTQFGTPFAVSALSGDGFGPGHLSGFTIGKDGVIQGNYTNGQSVPLGQVILTAFRNPNGLQPLGNNLWAPTSTSGQANPNKPGNGPVGILQSSATEQSNVDLTAELVNMITAQRVYQANSQTIKTQDQVLQTLVTLR